MSNPYVPIPKPQQSSVSEFKSDVVQRRWNNTSSGRSIMKQKIGPFSRSVASKTLKLVQSPGIASCPRNFAFSPPGTKVASTAQVLFRPKVPWRVKPKSKRSVRVSACAALPLAGTRTKVLVANSMERKRELGTQMLQIL